MNPDGSDPTMMPKDGQEMHNRIRALTEQEVETSPHFMTLVRQRIYRRTTVLQLTFYSWHVTKIILIEMTSVLRHIFTALTGGKGSQP